MRHVLLLQLIGCLRQLTWARCRAPHVSLVLRQLRCEGSTALQHALVQLGRGCEDPCGAASPARLSWSGSAWKAPLEDHGPAALSSSRGQLIGGMRLLLVQPLSWQGAVGVARTLV